MQAVKYLEKLYDHVVSQDKSAREALQTFMAGRGDVLLAYENEAIFAQKKNQPIDYVIPKATITIENPIAVTKTSGNKTTANAFLRFLRTKPAQLVFGENGYRPVLRSAAKTFGFPVPKLQFSIKYLGGLGEGRQAVLRPAERDRDEDPAQAGRLSTRAELCPGPPRSATPGRGSRWGSRPRT